MSTDTVCTLPFWANSFSVLMPLNVSTVIVVLSTSLLSYRYLPTHRMPLPHILPSLPSRLNMRIFASATAEGQMAISPSDPTEKRRGDMAIASSL